MGYTTRRFSVLGHDFAVRTTDPALGPYLDEILRAFAVDGDPANHYCFMEDAAGDKPYRLEFNDAVLMRCTHPGTALGHLMWHINRQVVQRNPQLVLVHAAGAEHEGAGILLPGAMESGKTTLVAGLVRAGFRYLTDEVVAIDPETLQLHAYAKPLSIDPGSWDVLGDLRPRVNGRLSPLVESQWQVPPHAIRADAVAPAAPPRLVIAPRYVAGAATELTPVAPADLLADVVVCTFDFDRRPRRNLTVLAAVLERSDCYRLTVGELGAACRLVQAAVGALKAETGGSRPPDAIDGAFAPRRRDDVVDVQIGGETFLFDNRRGELQRFSPTAAMVWRAFDGSAPLSELARQIARADGGDLTRIADDLLVFAQRLGRLGLLDAMDHDGGT